MTSLYDLTPQQQMELVRFARARLAEEKAQRIREIELKEEMLAKAEAWLQEQHDDPKPYRQMGFRAVGETWPAFMAHLIAMPHKDHADYQPVWDR